MIKAKKQLGQNFLSDANMIQKILKTADLNENDIILEIGPGLGALTKVVDQVAKQSFALEIDEELVRYLKTLNFKKTKIINQDFLAIDPRNIFLKNEQNVKVIANLPYYITTPIINKLLLEYPMVENIYIMVQKEVAERLTAKPGTKAYGSLTVFCNTLADVKYEFTVSKNVFRPVPNVESAIISLKRHNNININISKLNKFLKIAFKQKRKTLVNNLQAGYQMNKSEINTILSKYDISDNTRAEELTAEQYHQLLNEF